jgi:hypothetical protein
MKTQHTTESSAVEDAQKIDLTNTELNWRVENNSQGLELLNMKQRHKVHNLKTAGYILNNVTPSGVALLTIHGINGYTNASVNKAAGVSFVHFDRTIKENA